MLLAFHSPGQLSFPEKNVLMFWDMLKYPFTYPCGIRFILLSFHTQTSYHQQRRRFLVVGLIISKPPIPFFKWKHFKYRDSFSILIFIKGKNFPLKSESYETRQLHRTNFIRHWLAWSIINSFRDLLENYCPFLPTKCIQFIM